MREALGPGQALRAFRDHPIPPRVIPDRVAVWGPSSGRGGGGVLFCYVTGFSVARGVRVRGSVMGAQMRFAHLA